MATASASGAPFGHPFGQQVVADVAAPGAPRLSLVHSIPVHFFILLDLVRRATGVVADMF
jgi:hypothetical protein